MLKKKAKQYQFEKGDPYNGFYIEMAGHGNIVRIPNDEKLFYQFSNNFFLAINIFYLCNGILPYYRIVRSTEPTDDFPWAPRVLLFIVFL